MNATDLAATTAAMNAELDTDPVFRPSSFWSELAAKNAAWLEQDGLQSCRRTVSMNYFNWMIMAPHHPLFRAAVADWIKHPSLAPLRARIERDVTIRLYTHDRPVRVGWAKRQTYKLFVAMLWDHMLRLDRAGLARRIEEPEIGNPIRIHHRGRLIANDLCCAITEANTILPHVEKRERPRICEIGAGYGRLAYVISKARKGLYCIFDVPPTLNVSQWYLTRSLPEHRIFRFRRFDCFDDIAAELAQSDVAFFTPNQLRAFPDGYFDVAASVSTLPELTLEQVEVFLELMQRTSRGFIYLKQWHRWKNEKDGTDLTIDAYRFAPEWHRTLYRADPLIPSFFEAVWERRA